MFKTIKNALKTPEVRKKLLYTLLLIVIFRLGCFITVPGVDGVEGLQKIKAEFPEASVIMCSAMGQQPMILKAIKSGAKDFIVKPFQAERVIEAVKKIIG